MNVFTSLALGIVIRSSILAALCALAVWLLRSHAASLRFSLWKWSLLALFAFPVLTTIKPPVPKTVRPITRIRFTALPNAVSQVAPPTPVAPTPPHHPFPTLAVYLLVTLLLLARFAYNLLQLHRLAACSQSIPDPQFQQTANLLWLQSGCTTTKANHVGYRCYTRGRRVARHRQ